MTQDEITVLAGHRIVSPWVMKLCMDVANAEREACAEICDESMKWHKGRLNTLQAQIAATCASSIRARGEA